ncbi:oligosaccharide flippase family protein [Oceanobacillus kimchii]|uniref:oligosaccharide flippase family protein n=1 Tax=Oceanobacillus kimchii TaxID=746691 RepID=UPI003C7482AC
MNKTTKLLKNSLIFAIGNLGSKIIIFLIVPLYTYYLSTEEYGTVDLITVLVNLMLPLVTLSIFDAVFRYVMDKKIEKGKILTNSFIIIILGYFVLVLLYPLLTKLLPFDNYYVHLYILIFVQIINTTLMQYVRAVGQVKVFALSGILNALVLLISNIIFLVLLKNGLEGVLYSLILSFLVSNIYLFIKGKIYSVLNFSQINVQLMKKMLAYSIPLIPNSLMWWIMNFSDRFIISMFLGLSANGIFAVANKIPSLINILNSIFFQAWQMSAIDESKDKNSSDYYSTAFNYLSVVLVIFTSLLLINLKWLVDVLFSSAFYEAMYYIPFLLLGTVFASLSGFLGTNYIVAKKTMGVFKTSIIGASINLILTLSFIPFWGLNGAAFATMVSFFTIFILRVFDTKRFIMIHYKIKKLMFLFTLIFIQIIIFYLDINYQYVFQSVSLILIIFYSFEEVSVIMKVIYATIKNKIVK